MSNDKETAKEPRPAYREYCYACRRAKKNCLCAFIKPFATRMRLVILMHNKEAREQKTGTARLAQLCLENSELLIGSDFTGDERVNALLADPAFAPFVLYPGPKAANFGALGPDLLPPGKVPLVFVIDGTWRLARSLLFRSKNVYALPRLSFAGAYESRFAIKRQPMRHCVSTIEAVYHLCNEAEAAGYEKLEGRNEVLMTLLGRLVAAHLPYRDGRGRKREENRKKNAGAPRGPQK